MKNNLDNFEQQLKNSLEDYEVPFNDAHWKEMERSLDASAKTSNASNTILGGILAVGLFLGGFYFINQYSEQPETGIGNNIENPTGGDSDGTTIKPLLEDEHADSSANFGSSDTGNNASAGKEEIQMKKPIPGTPGETPGKNSIHSSAENISSAKRSNSSTVAKKEVAAADLSKFTANVNKGCVGLTIHFQLEHTREGARYLWNFGDGYFSNEANPVHTFEKPGLFDVSLSVTSNSSGNISSNVIQDMIEIIDTPVADFEFENKKSTEVAFDNQAFSADSYTWNFGDQTSSSEKSPTHLFKQKGQYMVSLVAHNKNGCADTITKMVEVKEDYVLKAPRYIIPGNSRSGYFMPEDLKEEEGNFILSIYDPVSGIVIFESGSIKNPWKGKIKDKVVNPGDYPWFVEIKKPDGSTESYKGKIEVRQQ